MKKILIMIVVCTIFITGCTNEKYEEMMTSGKTAIANEEYEKAENFFSLALEEKNNDKEAEALANQVTKLNEAIKLRENKKYNEVIKLCEEINSSESESDIIKKVSNGLKEEVQDIVDENNKLESMIKDKFESAKKLIDDGDYKEAKNELDYIIEQISDNQEFKSILDQSKKLLNTCNENIKKQEAKEREEYTKDQIQKALQAVYNVSDSNGCTYSYTNANNSYIASESESFKSKYYVFNQQYGDAMSDCNYLVDKQTFEVYLYYPGGELQKIN